MKILHLVLKFLNLIKGDKYKRAAVLLFAKNPQKYFLQARIRIGKFLNEAEILTSDIVEGNLFRQVDLSLDILRTKYLLSPISYEGIYRREKLEYPYASHGCHASGKERISFFDKLLRKDA